VTLVELHAALNDFPPALIVASVAFDLWGAAKKRNEFFTVGYWCLVAGAAMGILAVVSGLLAEDQVQQTPATHQILENHESLGIGLGILFVGLAAWRIWRKNSFSVAEKQSYTMISLTGALALLWLSHLGGTLAYRHAAGVPTDLLQQEIQARADSSSHPKTP
jgi:uncharacterized membrane protein